MIDGGAYEASCAAVNERSRASSSSRGSIGCRVSDGRPMDHRKDSRGNIPRWFCGHLNEFSWGRGYLGDSALGVTKLRTRTREEESPRESRFEFHPKCGTRREGAIHDVLACEQCNESWG